ncbi:MAG TPA: TolC family protein [Chthoniobacterales bacterium]|nr:TolC family protein [Chthoniobacterales bacterium]
MRKNLPTHGVAIGGLLIASFALGQPDASVTPTPKPTLESVLPTPTPTESTPAPSVTPPPTGSSSPSGYANEPSAVTTSNTFEWSEKGAPVFTIDKAVITALLQNATILNAIQEIERTKGVIIQIRAQALPQIAPSGSFQWTDPNLLKNENNLGAFGSVGGGTPTPTPAPGSGIGGVKNLASDITYSIKVIGTQEIFNYSTWASIRGTFFQRDSAYFAFRNTVDQIISTTTQEFYQVILDRELIVVQEDSVRLLESQLKDQENRFEAGTVPRFNVLQAQVQLSNQIPLLIAARNNYRISILTLAKTLGLDFNPARGIAAPLRVVGELTYIPRKISLLEDIEFGKQHRPFLKQARANVLNQIEQVHVALGGFMPTINASGGGEWLSSNFNSSWGDISKGWETEVVGSWPVWDSGLAYGQYKQQRALLQESKITYDDDVRQVELDIQTAASNLLQNRELIKATEKTVEQADEAVRLAKARLDAGAGTQLDVLNAQVQLTTAQSTRLQALFGYISSVAEYDRVTGTHTKYTEQFNDLAPHATNSRTYYTGSDVDATGREKRSNVLQPEPATPMSQRPSTK